MTECAPFDALASIPKTLIYSINQMSMERDLDHDEASCSKRVRCRDDAAKKVAPRSEVQKSEVEGPAEKPLELEPVEFAIRRLLEGLVEPSEMARWNAAKDVGIPLRMDTNDNYWLQFRATFFTKKRKRNIDDLARYGEQDNLYKFGKATEWREMLSACDAKGLGSYGAEVSHFILGQGADSMLFLEKIDASKAVHDAFGELEVLA